MSRATMPIMGAILLSEIPFAMIAPHEAQAKRNHGQSLNRLADRGGLAVPEALDILEGRSRDSSKNSINNERYLVQLVREWRAVQSQGEATDGCTDIPELRSSEETGFEDWMSRQMPKGTIISNPAWWAPRILSAVKRIIRNQSILAGTREWTPISERLPDIPDRAAGGRIHVLVGRHYLGQWYAWSVWYGPRDKDLRFYDEFVDDDDTERTKDEELATHWRYMPPGPVVTAQQAESKEGG